MNATYNYKTGKITRYFKFRVADNKCGLAQLPCRVGSSWCTQYCTHFKGVQYESMTFNRFILCAHPCAIDEPNSNNVIHKFNEELEQRAYEALCY